MAPKRTWAGIAVGVALAVSLAGSLGVEAARPAAAVGTPEIAFTRDAGGDNQRIWVMARDGSGATQVSDGTADDVEPAWSPDGSRIAFTSNRDGNWDLFVMGADGGDVTQLTDTATHEGNPDWSPDGTKLVFDRQVTSDNYDVLTMNAAGGGETQLTTQTGIDADPSWSPDGTTIAFQSTRAAHPSDLEIYRMDADGTDQTRLTTSADSDTEPTWSPAGNQIAFRSRRTSAFRIYVMGATGTSPDPTPITDGNNDAGPTWAPDDSYVAFSRSDDGDAELWLVSREGEFTKLTDNTDITDWQPDWRPTPDTALTDVAEVSAGAEFSCALLADGQVRCWGYGAFGQLGNDATGDQYLPVAVTNTTGSGPLTGVTRLSSGWSHSCVVVDGGQVRCWGENGDGQLGNGSRTDSPRPVVVSNDAGTGPLTGVVAVSAGEAHSCALKSNGQVRCWGDNSQGQLGDGTATDRLRPVAVSNPGGTANLTDVAEVSAGGYFSCARLANGKARCWGSNFFGQLGDGTTVNRLRPVAVSNMSGTGALQEVAKVSAGRWHTCARLTNGQARCWGDNEDGQLGDGTTVDRLRPVAVSNATGGNALQNVRKISAGTWHTCAQLSSGQARCWGANAFGALGDGTTTSRLRPVTVSDPAGTGALTGVSGISAGEYRHSLALVDGDQARAWGYNFTGQLGDGTTTNRSRPVVVLPAG